jgi:pyruvate dehydrogenase E2 component (dihydrolipoamide acetyltransferase)
VDFKFPDVGEGLSEGTLVKWLITEGDAIALDQPLAQVETDKAVVEIPSPTKGTISKLIGKAGDVIKVGDVFVQIDERSPNVSDAPIQENKPTQTNTPQKTPDITPPATENSQPVQANTDSKPQTLAELMQLSDEGKSAHISQAIEQAKYAHPTQNIQVTTTQNTTVLAVPKIKHLAKEKNIDLAWIKPTGTYGHITLADITGAPNTTQSIQTKPIDTSQTVSNTITKQNIPTQQTTQTVTTNQTQTSLPDLSSLQIAQQRMQEQSKTITQKIESIAVNSAQLLVNALVANQNTKVMTLATPSVRRMARQKGIDINTIIGSGENGKITLEDLTNPKYKSNASKSVSQTQTNPSIQPSNTQLQTETKPKITIPNLQIPKPAPLPSDTTAQKLKNTTENTTTENSNKTNPLDERVALSPTRKVIAKRMMESLQHTAIVTTCDEADITELFETYLKEQERLKSEVRLSFLSFITKIVTIALKKYPVFNATLDEQTQEIIMHKNIHIGIAVATPRGLLVPVIQNADTLHIPQIAGQILTKATAARDGKLGAHELSGSTFTITNIGSIGGQMFTPIINYPEIAILGVGKAIDKPVAHNGEIKIRKMMWLSLSFDHRIADGADAAYFLNAIKEMLESNANALLMQTL